MELKEKMKRGHYNIKDKECFCIDCNKKIFYKSNTPKRCKKCKLIYRRKYANKYYSTLYWRKYMKKIHQKHYKPQISFIKCELCKKTIKRENSMQKFCNDCREEARELWYQDYYKRENTQENFRIAARKRRAILRKVKNKFTKKEWLKKINKTKGICPMCEKNVGINKLTLDHIFPISKAVEGREYTIDDVQPLCGHCNNIKQDKIWGEI